MTMADTFKDKASATYAGAKAKASDAAHQAKVKAEEAAAATKANAKKAADATRAGAKKAAEATKAGAHKAATKTSQTVESNPLGAIVGGLAIGAIVAALLPRTKREDQLVGKVGKTVRTTASKAAKTATATAKEQLDALGVNADAAKAQLRDLAGKISEAAASAGSAAADTVKPKK
jgi:ElaB/YqjD/DUF883 family membrane-anchored ribosome-binding protein